MYEVGVQCSFRGWEMEKDGMCVVYTQTHRDSYKLSETLAGCHRNDLGFCSNGCRMSLCVFVCVLSLSRYFVCMWLCVV